MSKPVLEALQIFEGVVETVYMIDAQSGDPAIPGHSELQAVACLEDLGILHPQADEVIDAEEAPVVDHFQGHPPVGQSVGLGIQQAVQEVEAGRVPRPAVKDGEVVIKKFFDDLVFLVKTPKVFF